jgi:elongator complex protein 2
MEEDYNIDYISAGGNRHPSAADWDRDGSGLLAYGAGNSIALWDPLVNTLQAASWYHN